MNVHSTDLKELLSMSKSPQIVLITGTTAGIARTTAMHLPARGHLVIATGRKAPDLAALKTEVAQRGARLETVILDVTSAASIDAAVSEVDRLTEGYGVDVLVNNAGFGVLG